MLLFRVQYKYIVLIFKMEEMSQSQLQELHYYLNQVVWAKITGFPWWPAQITAIPSKQNNNFRVDFFADTTHAFVSYSKIAKYEHLRHRIDINKPMKKGLRKAITHADSTVSDLWSDSVRSVEYKESVEAVVAKQDQLCGIPLNKQIQLQENNSQQHSKNQNIANKEEQHQQQQSVDRQHYVNSLLLKYNLHNLDTFEYLATSKYESKTKYRRSHAGRKIKLKLKRIAKVHSTKQSATYLLSKRLYRLLLSKADLTQDQRRVICMNLCKQIQVHNKAHIEKSGEQVLRLLKWISISSGSIITAYYESWSSLQIKENGSHMTTETEE